MDPKASGPHQVVLKPNATGENRGWRLSVDRRDGTFEIVNKTLGSCLGTDRSWSSDAGTWEYLFASTCRAKAGQKWYFHPTASGYFMIRNVENGRCLDAWDENYGSGSGVVVSNCWGPAKQKWHFRLSLWAQPTPGVRPIDLAVDHAAKQCQAAPDSCSWNMQSEGPAAPLPTSCEAAPWYNDTPNPMEHTFSLTKTTGFSNEVGSELEVGFETGEISSLIAKVTTKLKVSYKHVWTGSESVGSQSKFIVPAGQYGWVTLSKLSRKVTGTWTFDLNGSPWTANDTITVPIANSDGASTFYSAHTSATPPLCP
ncbi:RICIN domain-containing protein [Kitasatospora sp. NPDC059327]|uniref:RICIN domain-containing protein n=1 Tax=Kitasatospora sp. NPDC059327 TaxID=3346803 RepID=UPI0036871421